MASSVSSTSSSSILAALQSQASGSSSTSSTTSAEDMQSRFLNLLVTQLQNQDPLNPMDNSQMTTQLSQISTVSGIEKLNTTLEKLLSSYSDTQNVQAAAMIGKTVLSSGSTLTLGSEGSAMGGITLASAADRVAVSIKNSAGTVVRTMELGTGVAGTKSFEWDGTLDDGTEAAAGAYTFSVTATQSGKSVTSTALQTGTVNAVTISSDGLSLQLANGKSVAYADVKQIMN